MGVRLTPVSTTVFSTNYGDYSTTLNHASFHPGTNQDVTSARAPRAVRTKNLGHQIHHYCNVHDLPGGRQMGLRRFTPDGPRQSRHHRHCYRVQHRGGDSGPWGRARRTAGQYCVLRTVRYEVRRVSAPVPVCSRGWPESERARAPEPRTSDELAGEDLSLVKPCLRAGLRGAIAMAI